MTVICNNCNDTGASMDGQKCRLCNGRRGNIGKPPIGVKPKFIVMAQRLQEIDDAITRYIDSQHKFPQEWIIERNEIIDWLRKDTRYVQK